MRRFRAIIQSPKEPEDKDVFWLFKGRLLYYNNGQWVAVPLISQSAIDAANRANIAADKAELVVDDANTALESANTALEKATEFSEQIPVINETLDSLPQRLVYTIKIEESENQGLNILQYETSRPTKKEPYGKLSYYVAGNIPRATQERSGLLSKELSRRLGNLGANVLSSANKIEYASDKVVFPFTSRELDSSSSAVITSVRRNIKAATTGEAGVMSAEDKTKLENHQTLIDRANRPDGILMLDGNGLVPSNQLPSYVDDVLEFASKDNFPTTGETGKIYLAIDTNLPYRWSGSTYVEIAGGLALGETSTTAFAGDRGKKLEEDVNEQQETLDSVMGIMNKQYYAVSISSNPNVSVIEKGVAQLLQINWNSTFDGQPTTSTFVVKQGDEIINVPSGASSFNTEINDTTTFSVAGTRNGVTKTASKTINAYYPKYYGGSTKAAIAVTDITTFTKQNITGNAFGTYTITSNDNEYIWFCIPSDMTINKVTLGGFNVPIESPTYFVTGKGNYKCYRTANPLSAGTRQFVIS